MSQHDSLRERTEQHKPKNSKSKIDDKEVYQAMELVKQYLKSKKDFQSYFENDWDLEFSAEIEIKYMIDFIKRKRIRSEFCYDCIDRKIIPDGGVLYLVNKKKNEKSNTDIINSIKLFKCLICSEKQTIDLQKSITWNNMDSKGWRKSVSNIF